MVPSAQATGTGTRTCDRTTAPWRRAWPSPASSSPPSPSWGARPCSSSGRPASAGAWSASLWTSECSAGPPGAGAAGPTGTRTGLAFLPRGLYKREVLPGHHQGTALASHCVPATSSRGSGKGDGVGGRARLGPPPLANGTTGARDGGLLPAERSPPLRDLPSAFLLLSQGHGVPGLGHLGSMWAGRVTLR